MAQESHSYRFSLDDCLRYAVANSNERKSMELTRESLETTYEQSKEQRLPNLVCSAASEDVAEAAVEEIENILRASHKIPKGGDDDFEVRTQQEMLEMMSSMTGMITTVLVAIALISLLVGCIGIMNIMYVTVTERTKEIGLRMSIGAKNSAILMQFLTESIILSLIGGVIGLMLGLLLSYVVSLAMSLPYVVNVAWMVISFVSCAILGLVSGFFPALKASRTDPINALRYE